MSRHDYEKAIAQGFCTAVLEAGLRPFLADKGTYGIYTDAEGSRVVSFQVDLGMVKLSGNYRSENPSRHGTGWHMTDSWKSGDDLKAILQSNSPEWATGRGSNITYSTLASHLKVYQPSSKYEEVKGEQLL